MGQVSHNVAIAGHQQPQLPMDGDGICMLCKEKPGEDQSLTCVTCFTPWHVSCLLEVPGTLAAALQFECPDCSGSSFTGAPAPAPSSCGDLVAKIRAIEADSSLTERQKAKKRQQLMSGKTDDEEKGKKKKDKEARNATLAMLKRIFICSFCMELPERPVSAPCGHNYCLKCFQKWIGKGEHNCPDCRRTFPASMEKQPRINSVIVNSIREAKISRSISNGGSPQLYQSLSNEDLPYEPYITERAKRGGIANAKSGMIVVTVPLDHFGPISAENDPVMNRGISVGLHFKFRHYCRQWGVHRPVVSGIAGQSNYGAQSVVLSGGYMDDEDHGEWFLYTGSGGRDLSGNRRTNKDQSFDQQFKNYNQALRISCEKGYPVRVVRSGKDKRSPYAPEKEFRYDGIYRIEKCWRKVGIQGFKVCRYLFVRCDNEPAPWTSDDHGDRPRSLPIIPELEKAIDVFQRVQIPSWDYDEAEACWKWKKPPPPSQQKVTELDPEVIEGLRKAYRKSQAKSTRERLLTGLSCLLCQKVLTLPVTTPCAHNFCKSCLEGQFAGQSFITERKCEGGRQLRSRKNVMTCPMCPTDISDFLQNIQVNREIMDAIEKLQEKIDEDENYDDMEYSYEEEEDDSAGEADKGSNLSTSEAEEIDGGTSKRKGKCLSTHQQGTNKRKKSECRDGTGSPSSPLHLPAGDDLE